MRPTSRTGGTTRACAAQNHGAEIREGVCVEALLVEGQRAQGVRLSDGSEIKGLSLDERKRIGHVHDQIPLGREEDGGRAAIPAELDSHAAIPEVPGELLDVGRGAVGEDGVALAVKVVNRDHVGVGQPL